MAAGIRAQDSDELTLTVTESGTGQTFVYVGTIADGGGFVATLSEASPELSFTVESRLEGTFNEPERVGVGKLVQSGFEYYLEGLRRAGVSA